MHEPEKGPHDDILRDLAKLQTGVETLNVRVTLVERVVYGTAAIILGSFLVLLLSRVGWKGLSLP